jgi:tRNA A-37 threonylcarbamoyl transferase component Bud32
MPFASGREADVFALGNGRVLRRYRGGEDASGEAAVMTYVRGLGFPAPEVYAADGTDLVMERLDGPTLARALLAGEMSLAEGAAVQAGLLRQLHELPGRGADDNSTIVHLDLHPENVLITGRGPVVIDWRNAGDGVGDLDTALAALILAQVAVGSIDHPLGEKAGRMLDYFLACAPGDPIRLLDEAVAIKSRQSTLSAEEMGMLPVAAARVRGAQ